MNSRNWWKSARQRGEHSFEKICREESPKLDYEKPHQSPRNMELVTLYVSKLNSRDGRQQAESSALQDRFFLANTSRNYNLCCAGQTQTSECSRSSSISTPEGWERTWCNSRKKDWIRWYLTPTGWHWRRRRRQLWIWNGTSNTNTRRGWRGYGRNRWRHAGKETAISINSINHGRTRSRNDCWIKKEIQRTREQSGRCANIDEKKNLRFCSDRIPGTCTSRRNELSTYRITGKPACWIDGESWNNRSRIRFDVRRLEQI